MNNKIIIGVLLVIIVALAIGIIFSFNQSKESTVLSIVSNSTVYEGDSIEVKLTDLNNTSLSGKMINISVVNNNSTVISVSNITDNEGCVKLKLNCTEGNYTVNCSFVGDENYTSNSTSENLIVKKEVVEEDNTGNHYSSSSGRSNEEVVEWKKAVLGKDYDAKADPYNEKYDAEYSRNFISRSS